MENLPATTGFSALSPQQQEAHRLKIGVRAEAILSQFWRDEKTPDAIRALEIEGWIDVLENCSHSEIRAAWTDYQKTGPRTEAGRLYKPDAGALYQRINSSRQKPRVVHLEKMTREDSQKYLESVARDRINPEKAAMAERVLKEAGFRPKKFGGE